MKKVRLILRIGAEISDPDNSFLGFSIPNFIEKFKEHKKLKSRQVWNIEGDKFTLLKHSRYCRGHDICEFYFLDSKWGLSFDFYIKEKRVLDS